MQRFNLPALLAIFAFTWWMLRSGQRVTRREGATLLGVYSLYLAVVVVLALSGNE